MTRSDVKHRGQWVSLLQALQSSAIRDIQRSVDACSMKVASSNARFQPIVGSGVRAIPSICAAGSCDPKPRQWRVRAGGRKRHKAQRLQPEISAPFICRSNRGRRSRNSAHLDQQLQSTMTMSDTLRNHAHEGLMGPARSRRRFARSGSGTVTEWDKVGLARHQLLLRISPAQPL